MARVKGASMKVDLVIGSLQSGGAERQLCGLACHLHRSGVDVCVVSLFKDGPLANQLDACGVSRVSFGNGSDNSREKSRQLRALILASRLTKYWHKRKPDVVQAWLPEAQIIALPAARLCGIPYRVMAIRSMSDAVNLSRSSWAGIRVAVNCATLAAANCAAALHDTGWPIGGLPQIVVPNGVRIPKEIAHPDVQPARAVVVANLTPIKGHSILLDALTLVANPLTVDLVGRGPLESRIAEDILVKGHSDYVHLVGGVDDVTPFLVRSQFAVLPSPSEGLPNALLEAMAAGLPVVAFRVGGIPELVEHGETGLLVEPGDVRGLARAIDQVAGDPAWRAQAGTRARERAREFSWESVVAKNLDAMTATPSGAKGGSGESRGGR